MKKKKGLDIMPQLGSTSSAHIFFSSMGEVQAETGLSGEAVVYAR